MWKLLIGLPEGDVSGGDVNGDTISLNDWLTAKFSRGVIAAQPLNARVRPAASYC